jgi:hypothetical protein
MRVFVGCEFSGVVRDAFIRRGHDAMSCDLLPTEVDGPHHQGDIVAYLQGVPDKYFDLIILHPDCTAMALCGNGTYAPKGVISKERRAAVKWTLALWSLAKKKGMRVCLENPGSVIFPPLRERGALVQYVQPWQFGHAETKNTGLALEGLMPLTETENVYERMTALPKKERHRVWYMGKSDTRGHERSRSYPGISEAMAEQWG